MLLQIVPTNLFPVPSMPKLNPLAEPEFNDLKGNPEIAYPSAEYDEGIHHKLFRGCEGRRVSIASQNASSRSGCSFFSSLTGPNCNVLIIPSKPAHIDQL
jgi:hypothetical protein